MPTQNNCAFR
jgi:MFS family permease